MSVGDAAARIGERVSSHGLSLPSGVVEGCAAYLALLAKWNARINLTALPLAEPLPDSTIDKLVVEPLCAAHVFPRPLGNWIDLGSGGGSPAVPLRLAHPGGALTMVESRTRKIAFLRELVRTLPLPNTQALPLRFEEFDPGEGVDLVTMRAVRLDRAVLDLIAGWLRPEGRLICFGATTTDPRFGLVASNQLPDGSLLNIFTRARAENVPRGTIG